MSAYVVSHDTIDLLASAAARWNITAYLDGGDLMLNGRTQTAEIARILLDENVKSVSYRYDDAADMVAGADAYAFRPVRYDIFSAVDVLASVACLRYQSCEHPDYATSRGARLLDVIERAAIRALPGYDEAPWGWTRAHHADKVAKAKAAVAAQMTKAGGL